MAHWYDGALLVKDDLPNLLEGPALRFGASVFTTMRVYEQDVDDPRSQWSAHCDRLTHSIRTFGWQPPNWKVVREGCQQLSAHLPVLRITLFPDGREWINGRALPPQLNQQQRLGVVCWLAPPAYMRSLPTHKTGNYLACWLSRQQAQKHSAQEAILTNVTGDCLETATGNLWGWADGQWWTPISDQPGSKCLPGVMRKRLLQVLSQKGEIVNTKRWGRSQLRGFEAIAYSNCVAQLVPVHTILDGHTTLKYNPHHAELIS